MAASASPRVPSAPSDVQSTMPHITACNNYIMTSPHDLCQIHQTPNRQKTPRYCLLQIQHCQRSSWRVPLDLYLFVAIVDLAGIHLHCLQIQLLPSYHIHASYCRLLIPKSYNVFSYYKFDMGHRHAIFVMYFLKLACDNEFIFNQTSSNACDDKHLTQKRHFGNLYSLFI